MSNCPEFTRKVRDKSIEIIKSEAKIIFDTSDCKSIYYKEDETSMISHRVEIPEIDAYWCVHLKPCPEWDESLKENVDKKKYLCEFIINNEEIINSHSFKVRFDIVGRVPYFVKPIDSKRILGFTCAPFIPDPKSKVYTFHIIVTIVYIGNIYDAVLVKFNTPSVDNWVVKPKGVGKLLDLGAFADFTYKVKDKEFKVHRNILSIASPVFEKTFKCGLDETKNRTANIEGCDPEIFQHLLAFIYKGAVPENLPEVAMELYKIAHLYQIKLLQDLCYGHIMNVDITAENALQLYEIAETYDMNSLSFNCWNFIKMKMLKIFTPLKRPPFTVQEVKEILDTEADSKEKLTNLKNKIAAVGASENCEKATEPEKYVPTKDPRFVRGRATLENKKPFSYNPY